MIVICKLLYKYKVETDLKQKTNKRTKTDELHTNQKPS